MRRQPQSDTKSINYKKHIYYLAYKDEIKLKKKRGKEKEGGNNEKIYNKLYANNEQKYSCLC